jgi:hypothetical protein
MVPRIMCVIFVNVFDLLNFIMEMLCVVCEIRIKLVYIFRPTSFVEGLIYLWGSCGF